MIRTIIVDDELLAGVGVRALIDGKEDISVLNVFDVTKDAIDFLRENIVDVVITDIEMAEMSGLEFTRLIRRENLADGIIILSCHDEFPYAQEAISSGTDSYLLKYNVTSDVLIKEIKTVYQNNRFNTRIRIPENKTEKIITGKEIYTVGVIQIFSNESIQGHDKHQMEGSMLTHLLEKVVACNEMGTLFAPYNREMFVVFQNDRTKSEEERRETLNDHIAVIKRTILQYIDGEILFGLSCEFDDLTQMHDKYDEAVMAVGMRFYRPKEYIFNYRKPLSEKNLPSFSTELFLSEDGMDIFEKELELYLRTAEKNKLEAQNLQGFLLQTVNKAVYQILLTHPFSDTLIRKWSQGGLLLSAITQQKDAIALSKKLICVVKEFQKDCLAEIEEDPLSVVFSYIEDHLEEKISLEELADIACMSVPTFSKKFKEQTDMTLVQYLTELRIERAKYLLKNKQNSLEAVAEKSGFSNANYLVRVFKKVTGQTVSEYRR
jgi:YesN/AraC family two-component response regulator